MGLLIYDGKLIIPAPLVTIQKNYIFNDSDTKINSSYNITIQSQLLPNKGSPNSSGTFGTSGDLPDESFVTDDDKFNSILRKQEAIRSLFKNEGRTFEWRPETGNSVKCYPRISSINFDQGSNWVERCPYSIILVAERLSGPGFPTEDNFGEFDGYFLKTASDTWSVRESDDGSNTIAISRTVSATSARKYKEDGSGGLIGLPTSPSTSVETWELAKGWCLSKLNRVDTTDPLEDVLGNLSQQFLSKLDQIKRADGNDPFDVNSNTTHDPTVDWRAYTRVRTEDINRQGGSYSITETWILSKEPAIEEFTVSHDSSSYSLDTGRRGAKNTVKVSGTVIGLKTMNATSSVSKYTNASLVFEGAYSPGNILSKLYSRATNLSSVPDLNAIPKNVTISRNEKTGVITYSFEFDDGPSVTDLCEFAASVTVSVDDQEQFDIFAIIPIPGRTNGPIIQDMGTLSEKRRNVVITIRAIHKDNSADPPPQWTYSDKSIFDECIDEIVGSGGWGVQPTGTRKVNWWLTNNTSSWDFINGVYTANRGYLIKT